MHKQPKLDFEASGWHSLDRFLFEDDSHSTQNNYCVMARQDRKDKIRPWKEYVYFQLRYA